MNNYRDLGGSSEIAYIWQIKTPEDKTYIAEILGMPGCTFHEFEYCKQCGLLYCGRGNYKESGISFSEQHDPCEKCVEAYGRSPELVNWVQALIQQINWKKEEQEKATKAWEESL